MYSPIKNMKIITLFLFCLVNFNVYANEVDEWYKKATTEYSINNYKQAVKWYRKAAEQGHARAQSNLGFMYSIGRGVTKDDKQAVAWYQKAAEQDAQNILEAAEQDAQNNLEAAEQDAQNNLEAAEQDAQNNLEAAEQDAQYSLGLIPVSIDVSLYIVYVLGLILLIMYVKRKIKTESMYEEEREPESIYEEERANQSSNHRIILCPDCSQKIRFSVPLIAEIIKCQKCDTRLSLRVDEDGHVYVTSQDKKQKDHSESKSETLVEYFEVLGLPIDAAPDEVRSAYKKKINEYHPDKVSRFGEKIRVVAEKEAKKINHAYFTLKELGYA